MKDNIFLKKKIEKIIGKIIIIKINQLKYIISIVVKSNQTLQKFSIVYDQNSRECKNVSAL
jgi:hypothetical protein